MCLAAGGAVTNDTVAAQHDHFRFRARRIARQPEVELPGLRHLVERVVHAFAERQVGPDLEAQAAGGVMDVGRRPIVAGAGTTAASMLAASNCVRVRGVAYSTRCTSWPSASWTSFVTTYRLIVRDPQLAQGEGLAAARVVGDRPSGDRSPRRR